jgi:signal transduction histidine kinase/phage shock protein PspC (stress-responsive transcriptional regulator)
MVSMAQHAAGARPREHCPTMNQESTARVDGPATASPAPRWRIPRLRRDDRLVGGVASGVAEEIGVAPLMIRAYVVVLALTGWGVVLYAVAWGALALHEHDAPAVDAAPRVAKGANPTTRAVGVGMVFLGLLLGFRAIDVGFEDAIVWPAALLALGVIIAGNRGALHREGQPRSQVIARIGVGLALALAGLVVLVSTNLDRSATVTAIGAIAAVGIGLAVVVGPWLWGSLDELAKERRSRIRSEARAEVAAHLHDSVLQTLALIQRRSDDPAAMVALARRQERELRAWLFADETGAPDDHSVPLRGAIEGAAAAVEDLHHVPIEVVAVGDLDMGVDERLPVLVAAAREAMTNASLHSGAASVDVYVEVHPDRVEVFVRDTGKGFDPDAVADDRRGLADSVIRRMRRIGGSATVETAVGEGTEVVLTLEREVAP